MAKYDEICQECLHYLDVSNQIDEINPKFASSLNIFSALIEKELVSVDIIRDFLISFKDLLYSCHGHALNFKDMKRDLYDLVLDDILIVANVTERFCEHPEDANTLELTGFVNGAISMDLPDAIESIRYILF